MLGTLTPVQKKDWKSHVPALVHAYNCTRNTATGFILYYLLLEGSLGSLWMQNLVYRGGGQKGQRCRGAELVVGDLVLVKQTTWKGRHKIQDRWQREEYQVVGQPMPGVHVYTLQGVAGSRTMVLQRNLLLPLQGRVRQQGGTKREGISSSRDEEEGGDKMPIVTRSPHERPRRSIKL